MSALFVGHGNPMNAIEELVSFFAANRLIQGRRIVMKTRE
jgi:aromatic ring-opening dioxygenase catalytic subunit (LigB family)